MMISDRDRNIAAAGGAGVNGRRVEITTRSAVKTAVNQRFDGGARRQRAGATGVTGAQIAIPRALSKRVLDSRIRFEEHSQRCDAVKQRGEHRHREREFHHCRAAFIASEAYLFE